MDTIPDCSICDYLKKIFYKPVEKHHTDYHCSEHINYLKVMKKKYARYSQVAISKKMARNMKNNISNIQ